MTLSFPNPKKPMKLLCLGAHSDDIEIGCGGTIFRLVQEHPDIEVIWVVFGAAGARKQEAVASAKKFLTGVEKQRIIVKQFKESFFPYVGDKIKAFFEQLKAQYNPDLVLTHYRLDLHQDHRVISETTWNTFRNHLIWEYEIPKYDGDLGIPNLFVPLERFVCERKVRGLMESFSSQRSRRWFTEDTFWALLRLRGMESNAISRFAEAYYCRKMVV